MAPPNARTRDRWLKDLSEDRETRDLQEQSGRKDLTHDRGTRDVVNDLGRRELEQLGVNTTRPRVLPLAISISGGILTAAPRKRTRRARGKRRSAK
ncbi:MAG: hypothetical protein WCB19_10910 [Thermoplasmata archaeon]